MDTILGLRYDMIVFTDVDGTLFDDAFERSTLWPQIQDALAHSLIVLTSSRTTGELLEVQRTLDLRGPFIAENGSVLVAPSEWSLPSEGESFAVGGRQFRRYVLGRPAGELIPTVRGAAVASGVRVEMAPPDVDLTRNGLNRTHSLLVRIHGATAARVHFARAVLEAGLTMSRGGRWSVIQAGAHKGWAARILLHLLERVLPPGVPSVGVGNAPNDRPLLESVDHAFAIRDARGAVSPHLASLPHLEVASETGLDGWHTVLTRLKKLGGRSHD